MRKLSLMASQEPCVNLCEQVLEPLREHFGIPVIISSGYRCPALNRALGGVPNSQHLKGEAADIILPPLTLNTHHSTLNTQRMILLAYRQRSLRPTGFRIQRHHQMDSRQLQDGPEREPPMHLQEDCIIGFSYRRELKLDARAKYPDCSLADLYDELTMPARTPQGTPGKRQGRSLSAILTFQNGQ